ncbi:hypothetical protein CONPUDRAFT_85582 [Coniophora puteana RWD-64-598 SS2]|uniref:Uncharacterized protein n=1 Tax=Coniophora puteana (strain RWD-64-598) TaxID=741705 RepID=A0A5M3M5W2_CONPW|nr:uncharacterized protein CONPUDRAFT_85582 [Coniophora puteana RWD-64-598 SS2]EIW74769.1 hypothetical protein CONPUDRAFT_85582 [Coniophora puteana RWD-64-598 SS2]
MLKLEVVASKSSEPPCTLGPWSPVRHCGPVGRLGNCGHFLKYAQLSHRAVGGRPYDLTERASQSPGPLGLGP